MVNDEDEIDALLRDVETLRRRARSVAADAQRAQLTVFCLFGAGAYIAQARRHCDAEMKMIRDAIDILLVMYAAAAAEVVMAAA